MGVSQTPCQNAAHFRHPAAAAAELDEDEAGGIELASTDFVVFDFFELGPEFESAFWFRFIAFFDPAIFECLFLQQQER